MAPKLRALCLCLASAVLFLAACGGGAALPIIAPAAPTPIALPTHMPAFGSTASDIAPATATVTLPAATVPLR